MRISFNQPVFLPWGGFFGRLLNSDLMILLDQTQFAHGFTYVNRNRLKGPQGEIWITVPIKKKRLGLQKISQLRIHQPRKWSKNFLALVRHYYCHSLYFHSTYSSLKQLTQEMDDDFLSLAQGTIRYLAEKFRISANLRLQSDTGIEAKGAELLLQLALEVGAREVLLPYLADRHLDPGIFTRAGLRVYFLRYTQAVYPQFWGNFIENLSALDLWLCCGSDGLEVIKKSSKIISKT